MGMAKALVDDMVTMAYQRRTVLLLEPVTAEAQARVSEAIFGLNLLGEDPITLMIDSGGGNIRFTEMIVDAARCSRAPVNALVVGEACSAAFYILQNCERRISYPRASFMLHGVRFDMARIDNPNFSRNLEDGRRYHKEMLECTARRSGHSLKECARWSRQERSFLAPEALKLGLIDEIFAEKPLPGAPAKQ